MPTINPYLGTSLTFFECKHKVKFNAMELEVLVEEANKHVLELQQRNINFTQRNTIWESLCEKVNAVGKTKRTTDVIKSRWQAIRRRTREKRAHNETSANKTGGAAGAIHFLWWAEKACSLRLLPCRLLTTITAAICRQRCTDEQLPFKRIKYRRSHNHSNYFQAL